MNDLPHYDIIGDIHGRFDKLTALMERMGYRKSGEGFTPPDRHKAIFLGDLIDPKPGHALAGGIRSTLRAVKAMIDAGDAQCIMGNHELNAIYFHSKGPDGQWMRHRGEENVRIHKGTLADFPDHSNPEGEWLSLWMPWMKNLPFFLDLGGFRVVHATWHPKHIDFLAGKTLEDEAFFLAACDKFTPEGEALDALLKGVEVELPHGFGYLDHTGISRQHIRARWWKRPDDTIGYDELVFPSNPLIPSDPVNDESFAQIPGYAPEAPPVFFGHYFKPANSPLHPEMHNVACLDHSAAKDGPLVAYRWKGCKRIHSKHYIRHE